MTRVLYIAVVGLFLLVITACGGVESEPNLAKAVERTEATGSARLELSAREIDAGETMQGRCEGVFDYAGKRSRLVCDLQGAANFEIIELGNVTYWRSEVLTPGTSKPWARMPTDQEAALSSVSPEWMLTMLRSASRETERIGEEEVRGQTTMRYRMTVDCDGAEIKNCQGETTPVDVWIDGDGLVRRIVIDDAGVTAMLEFFDFGVEVDIQPPPSDQVGDIDDLFRPRSCQPGGGTPINESQALETLRGRGFSVGTDAQGCFGSVVAVLENRPEDAHRQGYVSCFLYAEPPQNAPRSVVRRGVDGGDAEFLLANLTCMILADSPNAEEKIRPLEEAFEELERAIRP